MQMKHLGSIRIVRVTLALAVAFWMAGAGCLLGCENMIAAASSGEVQSQGNDLTIVASGDACASRRSHDCCASHAKKQPRTSHSAATVPAAAEANSNSALTSVLGQTPTSMRDCPLAINASAALSKTNYDPSASPLLLARPSSFVPDVEELTRALSPQIRLPNRGHTYLRCCVFLI